MYSERLVHFPAFTRLYLLLRQDHDVKSCQYICVCAETFPYGAFNLVSGHGSLHRLPGYRQSEPRKCLLVPARQDNKLRVPGAAGCFKYVIEIRCAVQSVFSQETAQADKRFLPLALRDFSICRPALVRMRTRKPWRRFRLILLGWYVRFIIDLCSFRKPRAFYFFVFPVVNERRSMGSGSGFMGSE